MIDIKLLREQPDLVQKAIARKKFNVDLNKVIELDTVPVSYTNLRAHETPEHRGCRLRR